MLPVVAAFIALPLLAWFQGCTADDPLEGLPPAAFDTSATQVFALDRLPGTYTLYRAKTKDLTRGGLLLPPSGTAEWTLTLPENARFTAHVGVVELPGVELSLSIRDGAEAEKVAAVALSTPNPDFPAWSVDLSRWSARTVAVRVDASGDPKKSNVFLGSPVIVGKPKAQPRRIVVLAVDTLRPDHLGFFGYNRNTSPEVDAWAKQSVVFEEAWSPAPRTRPAFRTATTGRWPLAAVGARNIGDVFDEHGFATAGIVANEHLNPRFGFDEGYDLWMLDSGARANVEVDRALAWLEENRDRDTFLFLHLMDPHIPYSAPGEFREKFVETPDPGLPPLFNRWQVYRWERQGKLTDQRRENIRGLYDGEIAWTSTQVGRFLTGLKELGGVPLLVFHTDHGEEFWDHGGFEHNHTLYDELVHVALWFQLPSTNARRVAVPASLADIAPTLFDFVGFSDPLPFDGISLRPWIEGRDDPPPDRLLPVGYLRQERQRWGVIDDHQKYIVFTGDGREELYDLSSDPKETENLIPRHRDRSTFQQALAKAHGMQVGAGWRIQTRSVPNGAPITIRMPTPCVAARILDPEALSRRPANQEWGETPKKTPVDVGSIELSADRREVRFVPGQDPDGVIVVLFDHAVPPSGFVRFGEGERPLAAIAEERGTWSDVGVRLVVSAGAVIIPPEDEAERMAESARAHGAPDADDLEMLRALGYLGDEEHP